MLSLEAQILHAKTLNMCTYCCDIWETASSSDNSMLCLAAQCSFHLGLLLPYKDTDDRKAGVLDCCSLPAFLSSVSL